jgi:hypothetical protein
MPRKFIFAVISVCLWMAGHTAPVHAAIHTQEPNPQLKQVVTPQGLPVRSAGVEHRGFALELPLPLSDHAEDATKDSQDRCLWDVAVVAGCQPPSGSPFSAFPLVFDPDLPLLQRFGGD